MMILSKLLVLSLAVAPSLVSAAIFPDNTLVKMLDQKGFKKLMKERETSVVAFVAPWCGHCQKMAPEYSKAALGLFPLVNLYAVDCDAAKNKQLCAEQGVKGFPTIKMFPRGGELPPLDFEGNERTASQFFYFAQRNIPHKVTKIHQFGDIENTVAGGNVIRKPRALLMNKSNKLPLLWMVLDNKYHDEIVFWTHRDKKGRSSKKMGFEVGEETSAKVLIYPAGSTKPVQYKGILKHDSLTKFFDSIIDGSADLSAANDEAASEEFIPDPEVLKIEKQQEAEMLKLAHGGFADIIDFDEAVKDGNPQDFHAKNGYPGMMGAAPVVDPKYLKKDGKENEAPGGSEGGIVDGSMAQGEVPTKKNKIVEATMTITGESSSSSSKSKSTKAKTPKTGDGGQIVLDVPPATKRGAKNQPKTPGPTSADAEKVTDAPTPEPPVEPSEDHVKDEL